MTLSRSATLLFGVGLSLAACENANFTLSGAPLDPAIEAGLYPWSIETCAVSEVKKKPGFGVPYRSGSGGHAVMYLNGACLVQDAHYPELRLCNANETGPDGGVGVSANGHFSNAQWVATQGRAFFFDGVLSPDEGLTHTAYEATQAEAKRRGILDGVQFHEAVFDDMPAGMSRADFKYEVSISTDYGIAFGRGRYCAREPISRTQMTRVIDYLNSLNAVSRSGDRPSRMSVLENNCSHVTHNALAAAGAWSVWPTDRFVLLAALSFPVPMNEFVNQMRRANDLPLDDPGQLFDDPAIRTTLMRDDWLPTAPGALATSVPPRPNNAVYETDLALIFYDYPIVKRFTRWFDTIFANRRYTHAETNLAYFSDLYRRVGRDRQPVDWWLTQRGGSDADKAAFAAFYQRYYAYIDRMAVATDRRITSLDAMKLASDAQPPRVSASHAPVPPALTRTASRSAPIAR